MILRIGRRPKLRIYTQNVRLRLGLLFSTRAMWNRLRLGLQLIHIFLALHQLQEDSENRVLLCRCIALLVVLDKVLDLLIVQSANFGFRLHVRAEALWLTANVRSVATGARHGSIGRENCKTWKLQNLKTWKLQNLKTWKLHDLKTWKLQNLETVAHGQAMHIPCYGMHSTGPGCHVVLRLKQSAPTLGVGQML